jgi:hypothetical protein
VDRVESQIASVSVRETHSRHQEAGRAAVLGMASGLAWHGLADVPLQKLTAVQPAEFSVFGSKKRSFRRQNQPLPLAMLSRVLLISSSGMCSRKSATTSLLIISDDLGELPHATPRSLLARQLKKAVCGGSRAEGFADSLGKGAGGNVAPRELDLGNQRDEAGDVPRIADSGLKIDIGRPQGPSICQFCSRSIKGTRRP